MVGKLVASCAGRMDVTRFGCRAEGWAGRMTVMRASWMAVVKFSEIVVSWTEGMVATRTG